MAAVDDHSGEDDVLMHVRFGRRIPPRPFASLADAKTYYISALEKARAMMKATRDNYSDADEEAVDLARRMVTAFTRLHTIVDDPGVANLAPGQIRPAAYDRLVIAADELVGMGNKAEENRLAAREQIKAIRRIDMMVIYMLVGILFLVFPIIVVSKGTAGIFSNVPEVAAFAFAIIWGYLRDARKEKLRVIKFNRKKNVGVERAALFISDITLENICAFLVPPPQEV